MTPQPLAVVRDVEASSRWYQATLGLQNGHGGPEYEQLMFEGRMVLQLHDADAHEHPHLSLPTTGPSPVVLWFLTPQFDEALGACRTWNVESENRPQRGQFLPDLQAHSPAMGQKDGEKWTAAVDLQPTLSKSDRLLARILASGASIIEGPRVNTNAQHREVWLRDPDGHVVVAGPCGDVGLNDPRVPPVRPS